jgi:hypothetical protein
MEEPASTQTQYLFNDLGSNHIKKGGFSEALNHLKDLNCLDISIFVW